MRVPSPEAMLVHLAAHAAGDLFRKLIFPVDIALLLRYERELDWPRVRMLAEGYAVRRDLRLLLEFVADYFGLETPIEREKREAPLTPAAIFAAMRVDGKALVWRRWRRAQNLQESLLSLGQILFPAPATMRRFYGVRSPLRIGVYYLLRPFHLAARLGRTVVSNRHIRDSH